MHFRPFSEGSIPKLSKSKTQPYLPQFHTYARILLIPCKLFIDIEVNELSTYLTNKLKKRVPESCCDFLPRTSPYLSPALNQHSFSHYLPFRVTVVPTHPFDKQPLGL